MGWILQKADGAKYGPVSPEALAEWAAEGRITRDDTVSPDGETWYAPQEVDGLGFDWYLHGPDGVPFGPLHILSLGDAVQTGDAGLMDTITHRETREARRVVDELLPALLRRNASLLAALAAESERTRELEGRATAHAAPGETSHAHDQLRIEVRDLRTRVQEGDREIERLKGLLEQEGARARATESELQGRLRSLQDNELRLLKELDAATAKGARQASSADAADPAQTSSAYSDLLRNYELLMQQFTAKTADLTAAYDQIERLKAEHQARDTELESSLTRERDDAGQARRRLAEVEEAHVEILKSSRELNDRYIRLRQKLNNGAEAGQTVAAPKPAPVQVPPDADGGWKRKQDKPLF